MRKKLAQKYKERQYYYEDPKDLDEGSKQNPWLVFSFSIGTVAFCCLISQFLVKLSKNYKLQLNKYYLQKKYDKLKMI